MNSFHDWLVNPARARLRRIRDSLVAGAALDPEDAAYLIEALTEIDQRWPKRPKKPADKLGRLFAQAFGVTKSPGRPKYLDRSALEEAPRIALARAMFANGADRKGNYQPALEATAEAHHKSEATVARAYSDHRKRVESERTMVEALKRQAEQRRTMVEALKRQAEIPRRIREAILSKMRGN